MSTLKVDNIRHNNATSDAITMASDGTCTAKITGMTGGGALSHRNMIINGGMMVSQRGSSAAITGGSNTVPVIDRYMAVANSSMTYNVTISQETDNPDGLGKSFKSLTTSAKTPSGSENYIIRTKLEEQDITRIGFGTSGCKKTTLTFYVKSNKIGTYSLMVAINSFDINFLTSYTINAQNTWEKKTISIPEYTTSYTHLPDNGSGLTIDWHLSSGPDDIVSAHSWQTSATNARAVTGQVNILDAVNNYWQLANVQYEVGEVSTQFEHRYYADELARCQRYCVVYGGSGARHLGTASAYNSTNLNLSIHLPVPMRTSPSASTVTTGGNWLQSYVGASGYNSNASISIADMDQDHHSIRVYLQNAHSGLSAGQALWIHTLPNAKLILSSEFSF